MVRKRSFDEALAEAARLGHELSEHKWRLGEIAAEQIASESDARLGRLAEAAGVSINTMLRYRRTALRFPAEQRHDNISFSVYAELAPREDRFDVLAELVGAHGRVTIDVLRDRLGMAPARYSPPRTTDDAVGMVREALTDPVVAEGVLRDDDARHAVEKARVRVEAEQWNSPEARRRREQTRQTIEPVVRKAANMAVPWADIKLADAAEAIHELVEDDADIEERFLTAWQGRVRGIATDLAVYCARRGIDVDFAEVALGGTGGES